MRYIYCLPFGCELIASFMDEYIAACVNDEPELELYMDPESMKSLAAKLVIEAHKSGMLHLSILLCGEKSFLTYIILYYLLQRPVDKKEVKNKNAPTLKVTMVVINCDAEYCAKGNKKLQSLGITDMSFECQTFLLYSFTTDKYNTCIISSRSSLVTADYLKVMSLKVRSLIKIVLVHPSFYEAVDILFDKMKVINFFPQPLPFCVMKKFRQQTNAIG